MGIICSRKAPTNLLGRLLSSETIDRENIEKVVEIGRASSAGNMAHIWVGSGRAREQGNGRL